MWTAEACGESQFFHRISVLSALTPHRSRCQGPFLCSSDTGQRFLQKKNQTLHITNCHPPKHDVTCSKETSNIYVMFGLQFNKQR